jgi:glutathione synthase/RimK-type ligase-like ATP-grasp enzyme
MENPEGFFVYDHLAFEPLRNLGWDVVEVPWSQPTREWADFDAVVIRSPWDYQNAPERFMATLSAIEQAGTRLFNPLRVCQWNLNKVYLRDLQQRGVPIVPTQWMDRLDETRLANLFSEAVSSSRLVVKPTIGANADGIFVLSRDEKDQSDRAVKEYATRPSMVQPFLSSIQTTGEYSLFYFGGRYSHAILKQPKAGDFRVQEEHGGIIRATTPSGPMVHTATQAMKAVGETLLYARVDIVLLDDGSPAVAELELIEPSLYFSYDSDSPRLFAEALNEMWTRCS